MKNRIKYIITGVFVCLFVSGCNTDKALVLGSGTEVDAAVMADEGAEAGEQINSDAAGGNSMVYVHVCGAVNDPRVVVLPSGSRGCEAIEAAGGFAEDAAEEAVNLAQLLVDGAQLYVPTREEAAAEAEAVREAESGLVDINRADAAQLCTLPGIGEARAKAIIAYREANGNFKTPEDIMKVSGIKEGAFAKIKDMITVKQ